MSVRPRDRFLTFRRDHYTCQYCGKTPPEIKLECDHVVARANGGSDDLGNLITACRECNIGKRTTDVVEREDDIPRRYDIYSGGHPEGYTCGVCGTVSETSVFADDPKGWEWRNQKSLCPVCAAGRVLVC